MSFCVSLLLQSIYYHNKQQKEAAEKVSSLRSLAVICKVGCSSRMQSCTCHVFAGAGNY